MVEIESVAADARIFMYLASRERLGWLSPDGSVDSALVDAKVFELPRCPVPTGESAVEFVARVGRAVEGGWRVERVVVWPELLPPSGTGAAYYFPPAVGMLFS
jgi:hypothetical protein